MRTFFRVCRSQGLAPQRGIRINVGSAVAGCMGKGHIINAGEETRTVTRTSVACTRCCRSLYDPLSLLFNTASSTARSAR